MKTKRLVPNPAFKPELPVNCGYGPDGYDPKLINKPTVWEYKEATQLNVGDHVEFLCNGRGRGGHHTVFAMVTKVNKKTFKATEWNRSYAPGTHWTVNIAYAEEPGNGGIVINLSWKDV